MKGNSNMTRWIGAGLLVLTLLVLSANCLAGMAVSPLQQWVVVKPGGQAYFSITVANTIRGTATRPCRISVEVVDFTVSRQGKLSFGSNGNHNRSAVKWISFDSNEFVLEPGESKELKAKVSAPFSADGDYWAAVMVKLGNPKNQTKGVQVRLQTASGVFIHVARRNYIARGSVIDANVTVPEFNPEPASTGGGEPNKGKISGKDEQKQVFKISAELENDGLVAFIANGRALLYSGNWRRAASIPLYTSRRRIFPGDTRSFVGVMSQPLLPGLYKLRLVFEPTASEYGSNATGYRRKIIKDVQISVSDELARQWAESFTEDSIEMVEFHPEKLELVLNAGRFTTVRFLVANRGLSTVAIRCRQESDGLPEGWLELKSDEFALAPNTRHSEICYVRIPIDTQQGKYNGTIDVEVERSGLIVQGHSNVELHKIPVHITVNK